MQEYFSLKSQAPLVLNSKVVYKFTCSRDVNVTYIGTSARHLNIKASEHLNISKSGKSAIKEHIRKCSSCKTKPNNMKQYKIIRKCQTSYKAKIHEALVIKRSNPVLNKQLYANVASFLLNHRYSLDHLTEQFTTEHVVIPCFILYDYLHYLKSDQLLAGNRFFYQTLC